MVAMHQPVYEWVYRLGGAGNAGLRDELVLHMEWWVGCKGDLALWSGKEDSGRGWRASWPTWASQADKGVFRKVMDQRVGERRMLGCGGGSLFPSGLVGCEDLPEPRQSGPAWPGLGECGPTAGDPGEQEWAGRGGEGRRRLRAWGRKGARTPGPVPVGEITEPGRSSSPGRCCSHGPGGAAQDAGKGGWARRVGGWAGLPIAPFSGCAAVSPRLP